MNLHNMFGAYFLGFLIATLIGTLKAYNENEAVRKMAKAHGQLPEQFTINWSNVFYASLCWPGMIYTVIADVSSAVKEIQHEDDSIPHN